MTTGLCKALERLGWTLTSCQEIVGGYAAQLYRVEASDGQGEPIRAVYKRFAPGRDQEVALYERVVPWLPQGVPALYAVVEEPEERGMLIEAAGEVLKAHFKRADGEGRRLMLAKAASLLAEMHVSLEEQGAVWLREGRTTEYPFHSSEAWAAEALQALGGHVEAETLQEVRGIAEAFYPRLREWITGRWTFTHGDPHLENILLDRGHLRLIDWEYASLGLPQRDVAILLQDVLDDELHAFLLETYRQELERRGWSLDIATFRLGFFASLLDNTIMMLGWEIGKYKNGYLSKEEIDHIVETKLRWIRVCWLSLQA